MTVKELPSEKVCRTHHLYFPEENEVRPLSEYRINKEGKIHPVYCKRCTSKKGVEYQRRRREEGSTSGTPLMKIMLNDFSTTLFDLASRVDVGDDAEIKRPTKEFTTYAADQVRDLLLWYSQQRETLPTVVHDQSGTQLP
jgi:hypothetical protein